MVPGDVHNTNTCFSTSFQPACLNCRLDRLPQLIDSESLENQKYLCLIERASRNQTLVCDGDSDMAKRGLTPDRPGSAATKCYTLVHDRACHCRLADP